MKTIPGIPKIDSIFIGAMEVDLFNYPDIRMQAQIGYADSRSSRRLGSTSKLGGWSQATLNALNTLIEAMEQDVITDLCENGTTSSGLPGAEYTSDGVPGI